eukprot:3540836-Pyramimonas_sp.AAC.1
MVQPWSRCGQCRRCEWNSIIMKQGGSCSACGTRILLFKPAGRKVHWEEEEQAEAAPAAAPDHAKGGRARSHSPRGGRRSGKGYGAKGNTSSTVTNLLEQAAQATKDA